MVLLIYPSIHFDNPREDVNFRSDFDPDDKVIPFGILSVASQIAAQNTAVKLIDSRFFPKKSILDQIDGLIDSVSMIGFSVMTAHIAHALFLSKHIKLNYKGKSIVWGGIHPTLFPSQTVSHPDVDFIVQGEGERSIIPLLKYLSEGNGALSEISGLGYKQKGAPVLNPPAAPVDVNEIAELNYDLLEIDFYIKRKLINGSIVRGLDVLASRGCPYRCTFCVNTFLNHKKWRPVHTATVIRQVKSFVLKYGLQNIWFADDYMFGSKKRAIEIAQSFIDNHITLAWEANIRANNFGEGKIDDQALALIARSGCYTLYMGFESGSDRMLEFYKKDIAVKAIVEAVTQCKKYGIYVKGFFIMGSPTETRDEIFQTLRLIYRLSKIYKKYVPYSPGIYRPYPGGELYQYVVEHYQFKVPASLEEWAKTISGAGYLNHAEFAWVSDAQLLTELRFYGRLIAGYYKGLYNKPYLLPVKLLVFLARLRFKTGFWNYRFEAKAFYFLYRFIQKHHGIKRVLKIPSNL